MRLPSSIGGFSKNGTDSLIAILTVGREHTCGAATAVPEKAGRRAVEKAEIKAIVELE